ncbi:MAG: L,D-transpeptidase [Anaerolineales bacterium]|nr:L,D-transpeptidase [Anaerolineales bacterium]
MDTTYSYAEDLAHSGEEEPHNGSVLCLPNRHNLDISRCSSLGPFSYLERMANLGVLFPLQGIPGKSPEGTLLHLDVRYGEVVRQNAPVFASLEDAVNRDKVVRWIDSPLSYISYIDEAVVDGNRYYMIGYGEWMTAVEISRIGSPSRFQGIIFERPPERPFGWILYPIEVKKTPGFEKDDYTGEFFNRYQLVQVFHEEEIDGLMWFMIAPDKWVPEKQEWYRVISRVIPNTTTPESVDINRWIEVNLYEQTISIYENNRIIFATLVSTGIAPFWTQPGMFQIYEKYEYTPMRGSFEIDRSDAYYLEDVPWTMYYDGSYALHGAYWHNGFGSVRSRGCINIAVADSRWIFEWAEIGDWVYIWDPSGETPTDPNLYGPGGA